MKVKMTQNMKLTQQIKHITAELKRYKRALELACKTQKISCPKSVNYKFCDGRVPVSKCLLNKSEINCWQEYFLQQADKEA